MPRNTADADRERQREILGDQRPRLLHQTGVQSHDPVAQPLLPSLDQPAGLTNAALVTIIEDIQDGLPCYGYRSVTHELWRCSLAINHKKVARVMRMAGLGIKPHKRFVRTTDSRHDLPLLPNLYRNLILDWPDKVWVADFTPSMSLLALATWLSFWMPAAARL